MIRSMTGFGKAEYNGGGIMIAAEVHSVNSRFLDLKLKLPGALNEYELEIRKMVQDSLTRGRVTVTVNIDEPAARANNLRINFDIAGRYAALAREMQERLGIPGGLDTRSIMSLPDVISYADEGRSSEQLWNLSRAIVQQAIDANIAMRVQEGTLMGADVESRLALVRSHMDTIRMRAPELVALNTARLREKIQKLIDVDRIDEQRIVMEIALYADRVDVTEECVRYGSHGDEFEKELKTGRASGKKLSFLLQEMNREANTIASKANDAGISQLVVLIKEEQEKMREQIENME
jgi:uncharacterized protein (TIGR00255 family)